MLLYFRITKEEKKALLLRYISIRSFVERIVSDTAFKILMERNFCDVDKELDLYHERREFNHYNIHSRKVTQETKDKISKAQKGKHTGFHLFPETKEKIRLANIGKHSGKRSEEAKKKMSLAKLGKELTAEHKNNIGLGHKGMKYKKHKEQN